MPEFVYRFYDYYKTPRGYHERSINSNSAWTATTPMAFFEFNLMDNLDKYRRPLLLVTGVALLLGNGLPSGKPAQGNRDCERCRPRGFV